MKKLFFVVGSESSGTRLTTRILHESGCFGDFGHYQRLDEFIHSGISLISIVQESELIVFRRSVPHGEEFPDIREILKKFCSFGCALYIIIPVRNCYELCKSKINNNGKLSMEDAYDSIQVEMDYISKQIVGLYSILFYNTSFLFKCPEISLKALAKWTKLDIPVESVKDFIYDADKNHQGEYYGS